MGAMSTNPTPGSLPEPTESKTDAAESVVIPATVIFEDDSKTPVPIRDPHTASLIFKPLGQGCFP